jgi:hypothetical protein
MFKVKAHRAAKTEMDSAQLPHDFDPELYLVLNADVARAVDSGDCPSAEIHYLTFGKKECRPYRIPTTDLGSGGNVQNWLTFRYPYKAYLNLPEFAFEEPSLSQKDTEICARIIAAWHRAKEFDHSPPAGMWAAITRGHSQLYGALEQHDPLALARVLANLFQSHITHGLAMGATGALVARHSQEQYSAVWCDRLLRLAEGLGLTPVRSPEQSDLTAPLEMQSVDAAISEILGFDLRFPNVGAPYGVRLGDTAFPDLCFTHAYVAWRIRQEHEGGHIAEIGGGFGALCYFMKPSVQTYTIFDLPYTNVIQAYFLLKSGADVCLYGETKGRVRVLPWWEINGAATFDLVVNQDSIPEMPYEAGAAYIARIKQIAPIFYSVNQEAAAANTHAMAQLSVPDLIKREGGYKRRSRNIFWLRDGYVEEVYQTEFGK